MTPRSRELTYRELRVLQLLAQGLTDREVGVKTGLSVHTVTAYIARAKVKLGANHRAHLVNLAYQKGLLKVGEQS